MLIWGSAKERQPDRVWRPAQRIERRSRNECVRQFLEEPDRRTLIFLDELSPPPADEMRGPYWLPIFVVLMIGILIGAAGYATLHGFRP